VDAVSPDVGCEVVNWNTAALDDVFSRPSQKPDFHRFGFALHVYGPSVLEMELRVCITGPTQVPEN
jgi:hypothetical protein